MTQSFHGIESLPNPERFTLYELDQQAQQAQRSRWHQGLPRESADAWRWIPYTTKTPSAPLTPAQQLLDSSGLRGPGAGATLAALTRRKLILLREVTITTPDGQTTAQTQIRLTKQGRATVRASHPPPPAEELDLPEWLMETLRAIDGARPNGLPKYEISRSAARRLGPQELRLIEEGHPWSYRLTPSGRDMLATNSPHQPGAPTS